MKTYTIKEEFKNKLIIKKLAMGEVTFDTNTQRDLEFYNKYFPEAFETQPVKEAKPLRYKGLKQDKK